MNFGKTQRLSRGIRATTPVLGNSDAEGEMIETNEDVFRSIKEIFTLENDAAYLRGLMAIPDVMVVLAYSGFLLAIEKGILSRRNVVAISMS